MTFKELFVVCYGTECSQEGSDLNKCELEEIWCHPTFPRFGFRSETE